MDCANGSIVPFQSTCTKSLCQTIYIYKYTVLQPTNAHFNIWNLSDFFEDLFYNTLEEVLSDFVV